MLRGMADQLKSGVLEDGLRLREYIPVGEMIPGMAYLVRRLLENTSNESWLRSSFADDADTAVLLATPHTVNDEDDPGIQRIDEAPERHLLSPSIDGVGDDRPFFTEPYRDFSDSKQRKDFAKAIAASSGPSVELISTPEEATAKVDAAIEAFASWRDEDPKTRDREVFTEI